MICGHWMFFARSRMMSWPPIPEAMLRSLSGRGAGSRNASALRATPNGKTFSKEHLFPSPILGIER